MDPKRIATETLAAFEAGSYRSPEGVNVELSALLGECLEGTREYQPEQLADLLSRLPHPSSTRVATTFTVSPESTLHGAARLSARGEYQRIVVLNFASARKPGGGFLGGAQAQEESLARSSALYLSLLRCPEFYAYHRALDTCLYSDRMIYSPRCPVVRDDGGRWLTSPYVVDFITSAAPNAGAILRNEPHNRTRIAPILYARLGKVLALAAHRQGDGLVLGAWGCGVFHNDPQLVASTFFQYLGPGGRFAQCFRHILLAIRDSSRERVVYQAFVNTFASLLE
ncbi:MAG TPA: TIGR02452 family protein [Ktedonobacterales bacterium]|nr:TIGR02452 family protein [Ktedonobacterales bacterium]